MHTFDRLDKYVDDDEDIASIVYLGDYAYEFYQNDGKNGDDYLNFG